MAESAEYKANTSRREELEKSFAALNEQSQEIPAAVQSASKDNSTQISKKEEPTSNSGRDDKGRFTEKEKESEKEPHVEEHNAVSQTQTQEQSATKAPELKRPTHWKKDYLPIWDKLAVGEALTPDEARKLAEYSNQREREFASGVSAYKTEAQNAKELQTALEPFLPTLQQHNIKPTEWIKNLGAAHQALAMGAPEQKLQIFAKLAQDYGVPLAAIQATQTGQIDPIVPQLMQHIQNLEGKINTVSSWRDQQEQQQIRSEISRFEDTDKYPHFESVRGTMAQFLESGLAHDLDEAYAKAVRFNDDVWQAEQERQAAAQQAQYQQSTKDAVAKAKALNVSPKSASPSGPVGNVDPKDRRALLEAQFAAINGGRV